MHVPRRAKDGGCGLEEVIDTYVLEVKHTHTHTHTCARNQTSEGWRLWFGGDVRGLPCARNDQELLCLHALSSAEAASVSYKVIDGIMWTTLEDAQELVRRGFAEKQVCV